MVWEAKAWRYDQGCHLRNDQIGRYRRIQEKFPEVKILFNLYGHIFQGIKRANMKDNEEELVKKLCDGTRYMIELPLSVILQLHGQQYGSICRNYAYRYDGPKYSLAQ